MCGMRRPIIAVSAAPITAIVRLVGRSAVMQIRPSLNSIFRYSLRSLDFGSLAVADCGFMMRPHFFFILLLLASQSATGNERATRGGSSSSNSDMAAAEGWHSSSCGYPVCSAHGCQAMGHEIDFGSYLIWQLDYG